MSSSSKRSWKLQDFVAHQSNVNCAALGHQTGRVMVTGGKDSKVNLWALGKDTCIMSLSGHATEVKSVQFGNTDEIVCAGSLGGIIKVWDLNAAKLVRNMTTQKGAVTCTDFHPYGDLLISGQSDWTVKLWDFRKKGCICVYRGHTRPINSIRFSPDGNWIASAGDDGLIRLIDIRTGKLLKQFSEHIFPVTSIRFHPSEYLLCSGGTDGVLNFYDLEKLTVVCKTDNNVGNISTMAFSKNGECLYVATDDYLKVYAWEPARLLDRERIKWGCVNDLALTDNQMIAASHMSVNISVYLLDLQKLPPVTGMGHYSSPRLNNTHSVNNDSGSPASPFGYGQSVRKSFSKDRPQRLSSRPVKVIKTIEEAEKSSTEEEYPSNNEIPDTSNYMNIFQPARSLNRTPPPEPEPEDLDTTLTENLNSSHLSRTFTISDSPSPEYEPSRMSPPERPEPVPMPTPTSVPSVKSKHINFNRQLSYEAPRQRTYSNSSPADWYPATQIENTLNSSRFSSPDLIPQHQPAPNKVAPVTTPKQNYKYTDDTPVSLKSKHANSVAAERSPYKEMQRAKSNLTEQRRSRTTPAPPKNIQAPPKVQNEPELIPTTTHRPVGIDMDEFLPKSLSKFDDMSEQEVLNMIMSGHEKMMAVLQTRERNLDMIYELWRSKDLKSAMEYLFSLRDNLALLVDLLSVFNDKPTMWDLEMCGLLLPKVHELLQSKYETYVKTGCETLKLILRNFSSVIRLNITAPVGSHGVDIPREERYAKCLKCHDSLLQIRAFLLKRQTLQGDLGVIFRELQTMLQGIDS